jgi:serine/threonine-protein kinase
MAKKERFGKFVLLEELGTSGLGAEYRAAKLGSAGALERILLLVRLAPALSANAAFTAALLEQTKAASLLHGPNILKLSAIGRVDASYYIAYEYLEGRSLKAALARSRRDGFPFTPDLALAITSKICATLEYAHGKTDAHGPHVHGLLTPDAVLLAYDGEVKLRGFGVAAAGALKSGAVTAEERGYLAPEQMAGAEIGARADLHAVGALLYEMLTGQAPDSAAAAEGLSARVAEIVGRAKGGAAPYKDMAELRKAVDALLYSGPYNTTAFNVAFFMHSLFREEIDRDARTLAEERAASYAEYVTEEPSKPAVAAQRPAPVAPVAPVPAPAPRPREPLPAMDMEPIPATPAPAAHPPPVRHAPVSAPPLALRPPARGGPPVALIAAGLTAVLLGGAGWYYVAGPGARPAAPPPTTLSADTLAAQARVRELEAKLQRFEQEKAEAEARAAEEAKQKLEAQAAAKGQAVDPAALKRAQDDARRRAQQEQERKQQEEKRRLEEEQRATEARLAEERRRAEAAAAALVTPPPTTAPPPPSTTLAAATPPPTTAPPAPVAVAAVAVRAGSLVNINDVGVIPPVPLVTPQLAYPAFARQQRAEGTVELSVLIDEKGSVLDARLVKGAPGIGLNQAAIDNARRRRYRPATKDGVPVRVYMPLLVKFELPQ